MSGGRILVVDDTPANIRLLEAVLTARGHEVIVAASGPEALERVVDAAPDLVLLDIQMPGMNGYEVCRRIRDDLGRPALPIVMVTATMGEERAAALEAGADDFVVRPFDQPELLARVSSLLRIKRYHDRLEEQARELSAWSAELEARVASQVEELDRLHRLRRFLPPQLAEAVQSQGEGIFSPHRCEIAVLVCRLVGFDLLARGAEPEAAVESLQDFHAVLGRLVGEYEATVGSVTGDSVVMLFNDPLPCDDPVLQAVRLAMDVRTAMVEVTERWTKRGHSLGVGSGVAFGHATLGILGFEGRYDYGAVGGVVDVAEAMGRSGAAGEILLTQRAHAAVEDVVVAADAGEVADVAVRVLLTTTEAAAPPLEIRVLGPLEIVARGEPVPLTAAKERAVVCLLAMRPGVVVPPERLADELWEGDPPDSALPTLRAHVSRIRKGLGGAGAETVLATRPTGYVLDIAGDAVDAARFERLAADGRTALTDGRVDEAVTALRSALALWRGPALADVATTAAAVAEAARLEELRLVATEDLVEAELAAGNHRSVLSELEVLTRDHPLRERLWAQRMVALYRSGRQAEALRLYQDVRRHLADELGLEPSPELTALEAAIATRSPKLDLVAASTR